MYLVACRWRVNQHLKQRLVLLSFLFNHSMLPFVSFWRKFLSLNVHSSTWCHSSDTKNYNFGMRFYPWMFIAASDVIWVINQMPVLLWTSVRSHMVANVIIKQVILVSLPACQLEFVTFLGNRVTWLYDLLLLRCHWPPEPDSLRAVWPQAICAT